MNTKKMVKIASIIFIVGIAFIATILILTPKNANKNVQIPSKYLTSIEWSLPNILKVAVEIEEYDGDIIQSGSYKFEQTNKTEYKENNERVYNIYVSKNNYDRLEDININDWELGLGGLQYNNLENITLEKGDYVYIVPVSETDSPIGHLNITLLN